MELIFGDYCFHLPEVLNTNTCHNNIHQPRQHQPRPAAVAEWSAEAPRDWKVASSQPVCTMNLNWTHCQFVASAALGLEVGNACTHTCTHADTRIPRQCQIPSIRRPAGRQPYLALEQPQGAGSKKLSLQLQLQLRPANYVLCTVPCNQSTGVKALSS
jgi:hypothetical protein